jgi:hypothetical protein
MVKPLLFILSLRHCGGYSERRNEQQSHEKSRYIIQSGTTIRIHRTYWPKPVVLHSISSCPHEPQAFFTKDREKAMMDVEYQLVWERNDRHS